MKEVLYAAMYEPDELEGMLPPKIEIENETPEDESEQEVKVVNHGTGIAGRTAHMANQISSDFFSSFIK